MYKALYTASSTQYSLEDFWEVDLKQLSIPYCNFVGTGNTDSGENGGLGLATLDSLNHMYETAGATSGNDTKIVARRKNADHGDMATHGDGYMVAWFKWHLLGDEEAKTAFFGDDAEILHNELWQDIQKNF